MQLKKAKRNKDKIQIEGIDIEVETEFVNTNTLNNKAQGYAILFDAQSRLFIETQDYLKQFGDLLDGFKDFVSAIQSNVGTAPSGGGPVVVDPSLVQKATSLSSQIDELKNKLV